MRTHREDPHPAPAEGISGIAPTPSQLHPGVSASRPPECFLYSLLGRVQRIQGSLLLQKALFRIFTPPFLLACSGWCSEESAYLTAFSPCDLKTKKAVCLLFWHGNTAF